MENCGNEQENKTKTWQAIESAGKVWKPTVNNIKPEKDKKTTVPFT